MHFTYIFPLSTVLIIALKIIWIFIYLIEEEMEVSIHDGTLWNADLN